MLQIFTKNMYVLFSNPTFLSPQPRPHTKATPPTTYFFDAPPPSGKKNMGSNVLLFCKKSNICNSMVRLVSYFNFDPPTPIASFRNVAMSDTLVAVFAAASLTLVKIA